MTPSFIVVDIHYNGNSGKGLYDPGANASTIKYNALKKIGNYKFVPSNTTFKTMNGKGFILGTLILNILIYGITRRVILHVLNSLSFEFDFIIGLDLIPLFKLSLDYNLKLTQCNIKDSVPISINNNVFWNDYMTLEQFDSKTSHLNITRKNIIRLLIKKIIVLLLGTLSIR